MMKKIISIILILLWCGCGRPSKSPPFKDTDVIEISGRFIQDDGEPLANAPIHVRNFRYFAYYDQTYPFVWQFNFLARMAFPFFPIYFTEQEKVKHKASYFFDQARTDEDGEFRFQVYAGMLLRDSEGGINISLVNDGQADENAFSRINFVIKEQQSNLGNARLCQQVDIQVIDMGDELHFSWPAPADQVASYEVIFASEADNSLVWAEKLEGSQTSLSLPKLIFQGVNIKVAVEAFFRQEEEFTLSCLSPSKAFFVADHIPSLARGLLFQSNELSFQITSLTNGSYSDPIYLQAFDVTKLELDFGEDMTFSKIILHNLRFTQRNQHVISITSRSDHASEQEWNSVGVEEMAVKRFEVIDLGSPVTARYLKFDFGTYLSDLQEISIY